MQLKIIRLIILFYAQLLVFSCNQNKTDRRQDNFIPRIIKAKGYLVPKDSMAVPKKIPLDENKLKKNLAGKPPLFPANINVYPVGKPKVVIAGKPKIITPGTDTFLFPEKVKAIDSPFVAGAPEMFIVKDMILEGSFGVFGKQHGLKHSIVSAMLEDKLGNIWFCTAGGISKYDGRSFSNYTEKEGLCNNDVRSILEDKSGNIWFGTLGGGVSKYDGRAFTNFTEKEGLSNNKVISILEDRSGNIWFGTWGGGVSKLDGQSLPAGKASFTHFSKKEGLPSNNVSSIVEDRSGNLWFGTAGGVSKYDGKNFANFTESEGLNNNDVHCILEDRMGNIWFGTTGGLSKFDGKSFTNYTEKEGLVYHNVFSLLEDRHGNIWIGTFNGISKFDGKSFTDVTEKDGLSNNNIYTMLEDRSGNMWFGTGGGGVSKYNNQPFTNYTENEGLCKNYVFSILEDRSGNMWFGTWGGGVSQFNNKYFSNFTEKEGLSNNHVRSMLQDRSGNIWFCTHNGVSKYDGQSFIYFTEKDGLCNNDVYCILEDRSGNIWIGTTGGVSKYDGRSFTNFTVKEGLGNNDVNQIMEDRSGNLWFATAGGVSKYDGQLKPAGQASFVHFTEKEGLCNNTVVSILEDKSGNFWFGTNGGGVSKFDGRTFTDFTVKEGLINNFVASILEDKQGNLWFGTRFGLSELTTQKQALFSEKIKSNGLNENDIFFKNYSYANGFLGIGCNSNAMLQSKDGRIWIGANAGVIAFNPIGESGDTSPPNIQLTAIKLFNENIAWSKLKQKKDSSFLLGNGIMVSDFRFDGLSNWYNLPDHLSLSYKNNFISFDFIGITMSQPQNVKYRYKLEGMDKNWSALTSNGSAPYGNLPQGTYTFKVKAMNDMGYWSKEFNYTFTIRPPWWKTWWFRIMTIVWFLAIIFFIGRFIYTYKLRKERVAMEKQLAVQSERQRISSDLHDDIGSTLSSINIYAGLAKKDLNKNAHLDSITQNINAVVNKLDDLVWSINPKYDALSSIESRLNAYAEPLATAKKIIFKIENNFPLANIKIPAQIKHNIYLIAKELINNAIKHSDCKNIHVNFNQKNKNFIFSVSDDGIGFNKAEIGVGRNGLNNIFDRVSAMKGTLNTGTNNGNGTKTIISIPF
ncbi:MAG: hypothetical protein IPL84_17705 [Chitinophagaceae bacterium]|nr:hypothetical protein [Chitinophagaceae bacterium]